MGIGQVIAENERLRAELSAARETLQERDQTLQERDQALLREQQKVQILQAANERMAMKLELRKGPKNERWNPAIKPLLPFAVPVPPSRLPIAEPDEGRMPERRKKASAKRKPKRRNLANDERFDHEKVPCKAKTTAGCVRCGGDLNVIGTTVSHRMDWRPGRFVVLNVEREKCACPKCPSEGVLTAPDPFALARALCGNGLLALVLMDKYADHLPLNRIMKRLKRHGFEVATSTLSGWVKQAAELLSVVSAAIERRLLQQSWLQGDDTGMSVQDGGNGALRKGRLWAFTDQREVLYRFTATKKGKEPLAMLKGFQGDLLLVDAGSEFNKVVRELKLTRAGCGSHLRRYFFEARKENPLESRIALGTLNAVFLHERELVGRDAETVLAARREHSGPLLNAFFDWLRDLSPTIRPKSLFGDAVGYALNNEASFKVFLDHPELPFHNNLSELQLRQPVVGRKNWLFAGSEGGAQAATVIYTLIGSCVLQGVDPWAYLTDVLERLPFHPINRVDELTPLHWKPVKEQ